MDETAIAFEPPHVRASATHAGPLLDRISVRDYVRDVEIGAFRTERGVSQRVRFNVVLEVSHHTAAQDDDVDKVLSYDTITEAIEHELAAERINLLETLAERLAIRCLSDPRAVRAFVRIEKLDRIPGTLGVEIARSRVGGEAVRLRPVAAVVPGPALRPRVVFLAPAEAGSVAWRDALVGWGVPFVLCLAPAAPQPAATSEGARRIGLLSVEQAAWALADEDSRFSVVGTRTELDWAMKAGRPVVWAPSHMVAAAVPTPPADASDPVGLASWLAGSLGASELVVAGAAAPGLCGLAVRSAAVPGDFRN